MKTAGIIAEYDPFHNGHRYHLEETLRRTGADQAVVVMSGPFVQRGTPAMIDPWKRAEIAVRNGASLVLELPFLHACGSSMEFASGAVRILHESGLVDSLAFGCETPDPDMLDQMTNILLDADGTLTPRIREFLNTGIPYAQAVTRAVGSLYGESFSSFLSTPNNLLAVEYIKVLKQLKSGIRPVPVRRIGAQHRESLHQKSDPESESMASGSQIRSLINRGGISEAASCVPEETRDVLQELSAEGHLAPGWVEAEQDAYYHLLKYRLTTTTPEHLQKICLVDEGLEHRVLRFFPECRNLDALLMRVKTRRFTYARLQRMMTYILMDLSREDVVKYKDVGYARILAFDRKGAALLRERQEHSGIPLISNLSQAAKLPEPVQNGLTIDQRAASLYRLICGEEEIDRDRFQVPFIRKEGE